MGRRKFAKNSENVRHFRLVSRSQSDPNGDEPGATPLVLEPFAPPGIQRRTGLSEAELLQVPQSLQDAVGPEVFGLEICDGRHRDEAGQGTRRGREDEEALLDPEDLDGDCYFPKDGYNYEQHLKRVSGGKAGGVVGVVLEAPSKVPKKEIALQRATNDEEAEVLRALDHAEEYEEFEDEELEDILPSGLAEREDMLLWGPAAAETEDLPDLALFREMRAQGREEASEEDEGEDGEEEDGDEVPGGKPQGEAAEDFDRFLEEEYCNEEIGACSDEEIEGTMSLQKCEEVLDQYLQEKQAENDMWRSIREPLKGTKDDVPRVIEETKAIIEKYYSNEVVEDEDTSSGEDSEDESRTWDCETVLSTLSNISNRPGKIGRIKVVKKPVAPLKAVLEGNDKDEGDKESDEDRASGGVLEMPDVVTSRPRGETPEERRQRKAGVREMRRVCRRMKKDSKEMYKGEALKLASQTGGGPRAKARTIQL